MYVTKSVNGGASLYSYMIISVGQYTGPVLFSSCCFNKFKMFSGVFLLCNWVLLFTSSNSFCFILMSKVSY